MALQKHPVDSFDKKVNFWEEFQDFKVHPVFSRIWANNRKTKLKESSLFMWALALCYDRKSILFNQPEIDKWEVVSEDLFGDPHAFINFVLYDDEEKSDPFADDGVEPIINIPMGLKIRQIIVEFEKVIDTPLGLSLRELERKLIERTDFIMRTPYSIDRWDRKDDGAKMVLIKGTAEQLDKMFANTEKINTLIQKGMEALLASEGQGIAKGGGKESLGDGATDF